MATPRGKIGRLSVELREQINGMLRDNRTAEEIIAFLKSRDVDGVTPQNVSNWKEFGYQEWLRRQDRIEEMRSRLEFSKQLVKEAGADGLTLASDTASRLAVDAITEALEKFDPTDLSNMLRLKPEQFSGLLFALSSIRQRDQAGVILRQKVEAYERQIRQLIDTADKTGTATVADIKDIFREVYQVK